MFGEQCHAKQLALDCLAEYWSRLDAGDLEFVDYASREESTPWHLCGDRLDRVDRERMRLGKLCAYLFHRKLLAMQREHATRSTRQGPGILTGEASNPGPATSALGAVVVPHADA